MRKKGKVVEQNRQPTTAAAAALRGPFARSATLIICSAPNVDTAEANSKANATY